jgi:hypothetical protein
MNPLSKDSTTATSELVHTIEGINRLPYVFKGDAKCICCCNA